MPWLLGIHSGGVSGTHVRVHEPRPVVPEDLRAHVSFHFARAPLGVDDLVPEAELWPAQLGYTRI